jgi:MoaA/NifB/PqqE/SkfB family radical SAM enzyme
MSSKDRAVIVAVNQRRDLFRVNPDDVTAVETTNLTPEEKIIVSSTRIDFYRRPFDAILVVEAGKIKAEKQARPNIFYPLTPLDYVAGIEDYIRDGFALPVHLFFNPTTKCNCACRVCFSKDEKTFSDVPFEVYLDVMKYLRQRNNVLSQSISGGGEPAIHPDILKILQFAGENDVYTFLTTNGCRSDSAFLESLVDNVSILCFSIQSVHTEGYQEVIRPPKQVTLESVLRRIEFVVRERNKMGRQKHMLVGVTSLVHPSNTGHYEEFTERLYNIGADYVHFNPVLPNLRTHGLSFSTEQARATEEELKKLEEFYKDKSFFLRVAKPLFKEEGTIYFNPDARLNHDACLVSILQPNIMPIRGRSDRAALVACRYQPNITTNLDYWYSEELGVKSFQEIWTPENIARISQKTEGCSSCCSENQLMTLDWMLEMKKTYPKCEFLLRFGVDEK